MAAKFIFNAQWCRVEGDYSATIVDRATSYTNVQAYFASTYRMNRNFDGTKRWDGRYRLSKKITGPDGYRGTWFPTGLIYHVKSALEKGGYTSFEYQELTPPNPLQNNPIQLDGVELRHYQLEAVEAMKKYGRGILHMSTASGKTIMSMGYVQAAGLKTLFTVYGQNAVVQTYEKYAKHMKTWLKQTNRSIGIVMGNKKEWRDITVSSISTLASMIKDDPQGFYNTVKDYDVLIMDETHQKAAESFYKTCLNIPAYYRFGLSGTPLDRSDQANLKVIAVSGPIIYRVTNKQMISWGFAAKTRIEFFPIEYSYEDPGFPVPKKIDEMEILELEEDGENTNLLADYALLYQKHIVHNAYRNAVITECVSKHFKEKKSTVLLVKDIAHGEYLKNQINLKEASSNAEFIHGKTPLNERERIKQSFIGGQLKILIASTIFDQAIDIPNIDVLVLAGVGRSAIKTLQRLGRGLRGTSLLVVEFADTTDPLLIDHTKKRFNLYRREDAFDIVLNKDTGVSIHAAQRGKTA